MRGERAAQARTLPPVSDEQPNREHVAAVAQGGPPVAGLRSAGSAGPLAPDVENRRRERERIPEVRVDDPDRDDVATGAQPVHRPLRTHAPRTSGSRRQAEEIVGGQPPHRWGEISSNRRRTMLTGSAPSTEMLISSKPRSNSTAHRRCCAAVCRSGPSALEQKLPLKKRSRVRGVTVQVGGPSSPPIAAMTLRASVLRPRWADGRRWSA